MSLQGQHIKYNFLKNKQKERGYLYNHANEETWLQRYPLYLVDVHIINLGVGPRSIGKNNFLKFILQLEDKFRKSL